MNNLTNNLPNALSLLRLCAAPVLAFVFWLPQWTAAGEKTAAAAAAAVFAAAAATDFIDGYWARKHRQQTRLGMFLDPVADKILVVTALLLLVDAGKAAPAASLLIIAREIFVSALREWAALNKAGESVKVSAAGKWKTGAQMAAVLFLFAGDLWGAPAVWAGSALLWAAAALAAWSMAEYARAAWRARGAE
ncbi:MAG: CDP-diacylglycerol--glycerol-3-phosphate 3-phosphatidyltransferase [Gammaproteobacteria bacterium]